ncbi:hypothetical protein PGT21_033443 [Puccinia graminis f. sp. tritici]|uniref:Uncharacterized protein n=1 Tax=Puccinia graminis f. sp. tritici TaxID=56615 RepID=A0A5B0SKG6_PUCGR|nr:hypothetical protein PGT21_033443 [Puccinia graminis f. sp. tritici]KAA1138382.1 hypothetical protein PGTUg99_033504 [Puccinia graminis f. sp. tritici]
MKCFTLSAALVMLLGLTCAMHTRPVTQVNQVRAPTSDVETKLQEKVCIWCCDDDADHTSDQCGNQPEPR